MAAAVLLLFFLAIVHKSDSNAEKPLKIDIYPGYGWDDLRFMEMNPIFDVSNLNQSDAFQSCIEIIPLYQNQIELGSTVIDMYDVHSNDYATNFMINAGASYRGFKISGSFSNDHQRVRKEQGHQQSITLRNQIDYLMADVILKLSCPLNQQLKNDIVEISKYQTAEQFKMASYAAQLFVRKYGTHFTNRLYLGGSILEEDFIQKSDYEQNDMDKSQYHAAAEVSFLQTFSLSSSFASTSVNTDLEQYKKKVTRKFVHSKGGKVSLSNGTLAAWQESIEEKPTIVRRSIENITFVIQSDKIPELSEFELVRVQKEINKAIDTYIQMNIIRGCTNRTSPSFDWTAMLDDGSCAPAERHTKFGGFIRTCHEDDGLVRKCDQYQKNNIYTDTEVCPPGFSIYPLHETTQTENIFQERCEPCGLFNWFRCCQNVATGLGYRKIALSACYGEVQLSNDSAAPPTVQLHIDENHVFGGSFTSHKLNPVTGAYTCPSDDFQKDNLLDDMHVCVAERVGNVDVLDLPHFGGMFSCDQGNGAFGNKKECLLGYTAYVMGTIEGNCLLYVCLDFEHFQDTRQFPSIALPPFFSINIRNQTTGYVNTTTTNVPHASTTTSSSNMTDAGLLESKIGKIQIANASPSKDNSVAIAVSITALCVALLTIAAISYVVMKKKRKQQQADEHHNSAI